MRRLTRSRYCVALSLAQTTATAASTPSRSRPTPPRTARALRSRTPCRPGSSTGLSLGTTTSACLSPAAVLFSATRSTRASTARAAPPARAAATAPMAPTAQATRCPRARGCSSRASAPPRRRSSLRSDESRAFITPSPPGGGARATRPAPFVHTYRSEAATAKRTGNPKFYIHNRGIEQTGTVIVVLQLDNI